ncbi:MAG TPA: site-specific integrase [Gaiellaceae bacterium]|nr:site-specific integrase [Gaiellaceae bacterium]
MRGEAVARPPLTLETHVDRYLEVHAATRDPNTIRVLRERLRRPVAAFGDVQLRDLERMAADLAAWQTTLPERSRYGVMQALRQALEAAIRWGDLDRNPAKLAGANPPPPPRGVQTFTLAEIDTIAEELGPVYGPMIRFAAATGMRPEEWVALERQDVARGPGVVRVTRTHVEGRTKAYGKTSASVREVPLSSRALHALDDAPPRLDTRLIFPGPRGAHVNLRNFRRREWHPALEAAGVPSRRIYDLRSTFASQALAAGVSVFELGRIMGTSVRMIERHYGALLQGSGDAIRGKLDLYLEGLAQERPAEEQST